MEARANPGVEELRGLIRSIPDFPRPGIVFRDVTPLFAQPVRSGRSWRWVRSGA
jgi:adenine/guanine phosphoribosyltransferase-like PRPP-binding protein